MSKKRDSQKSDEQLLAEPLRDVPTRYTLLELLQCCVGKRVTVALASGQQFDGELSKTTSQVAHLSKLAGRPFYDAIVRLDQVSAFAFEARRGL